MAPTISNAYTLYENMQFVPKMHLTLSYTTIIGRFTNAITIIQHDTDQELTFEELCKLVEPIARKHGMIRLYLFGSRARNESHPNSDYDFCLVAPKEYGLMKIGSFLYDLQEALKEKVDIICEEDMQTKPDLMEKVLRDRRIVFET